MNALTGGIAIAVMAHGLTGISLVWDKILLDRPATRNLPNYVFWLGAMSVFGLVLIPFGFRIPPLPVALLGLSAGASDLAASWFYYSALKRGEASQTLAVTGGFAPVATALIGIPLLSRPLAGGELIGFALMAAGGFVMFLSEKLDWRFVLPSVIMAAGLFGLANVLQKIVFNAVGFITGFVFFSLGTVAGAMALLAPPRWRRQIFEYTEEAPPASRFWYFVNRFINGLGSFLVFLAVSRANPAVVSAISGVRYVVIFLAAYAITLFKPRWLREDFRTAALIGKIVATALVIAGLVLAGIDSGETGRASAAKASMPYTEAKKTMSVESLFLEIAAEKLNEYRERIEICLARLSDEQIWARGHETENAIGNLVLHLAGNVRQWIVCSLGGSPDNRDRDGEFDARGGIGGAELARRLRETVDSAVRVIAGLNTDRLTRVYDIQIYRVSGVEAVFHVVEHFSQHTGQIIFATKMLTGTDLGFYSELRARPASGGN